MADEIERKFLVDTSVWTPRGEGLRFVQGYLSTEPGRTVRVRLEGDAGKLTIKGAAKGISRAEYEYDIPAADAAAMLRDLCRKPLIEKRRHREEHGGHLWEIDVFDGDNAGLVVAEIELEAEDEAFERPAWVRDEVSHDRRYANSSLVSAPYRTW